MIMKVFFYFIEEKPLSIYYLKNVSKTYNPYNHQN